MVEPVTPTLLVAVTPREGSDRTRSRERRTRDCSSKRLMTSSCSSVSTSSGCESAAKLPRGSRASPAVTASTAVHGGASMGMNLQATKTRRTRTCGVP